MCRAVFSGRRRHIGSGAHALDRTLCPAVLGLLEATDPCSRAMAGQPLVLGRHAMLAIAFAALAVVPTEMSTRDPQVPSGGGALIEEPSSTDTPAFSQAHMRFCRFQQVRLEGVGPLTDAADLAVFQALAQDWNTRCAGRSYEHPERRTVDAEAIERRELLESEGRSLLRAWRRKIRVAMKTPANSIPPASDSALASMPALPSIITFGVTGKVETEAISWPMPSNPGLALLHQSVAARVQRRLTELGYIISPVDGIWGAASRMALRHFKEANGLLSDDVLDGETVARLFSTSAVLSAAAA